VPDFQVFPHNKKVMEFYISHLLKIAGMAMIAIFIPLYLLSLGFSLSMVMIYFLLHSVAQMVFIFPAARFCERYGAKKSVFIAITSLILFYILLISLPTAPALVYAIPIIYGIYAAFYWIPFNSMFSSGLDKGNVGKEYGMFSALVRVSAVLGPLIGGILIALTGFQTPFLIALTFLVLAWIPMMHSKDFTIKAKCSLKKELKNLDYRHLLGFIGWGITVRSISLWHIFIFFLFGSYVFVGGIGTLGMLMAIVGTFIAGLTFDRLGTRWIFPLNTIFGSLLGIARAFVGTVYQVIIVELLLAPSFIFSTISMQSQFFNTARKSGDVLRFAMIRELMIHGGIAVYSLFFAIVFYFTPRIELAFFFAALTHMLMLVVTKKKPLRL